ncbi:MAG: glycosyltransferase family 87 protein [Dehalococcoidia bacterium]
MERSLSLQQRRPVWLVALLLSAALVGLLTVVLTASTVALVARGESATLDLSSFYTAGWLVREGHEEQLYDLDAQEAAQRELSGENYDRPLVFAMPAFVAYAFAPVAALPLGAAYGVMWGMNLALLAGCLAMLREVLPPLSGVARRAFLAAAALSIPVASVLAAGQVDLLILAALLGGYLLAQRGRPLEAGLVLSIVLMKPQLALGVLLLLLVTGQWRVLAPFVGMGAVLAAAPVLGMGFEAVRGNIEALGSVGMVEMMANWRGFLVSLGLDDSFAVWGPGWALIALIALVLAVRCWRRDGVSTEQKWAVALLLPVIVSPHLHGQSLVLLWPVGALMLRELWRAGRIDEVQALSITLLLFDALFLRWAVTLSGVSPGVFLLVPLYAAVALLPTAQSRAPVAALPPAKAKRQAA